MTENFKINLTLTILIEYEDIPNSTEEGLYLHRSIELPYIPQIHSDILCNLHSNDGGRRRFKVKYVTTELGNPVDILHGKQDYNFNQLTEVVTENRYRLRDVLRRWNSDSLNVLIEKCKQHGWFVTLRSEDGEDVLDG